MIVNLVSELQVGAKERYGPAALGRAGWPLHRSHDTRVVVGELCVLKVEGERVKEVGIEEGDSERKKRRALALIVCWFLSFVIAIVARFVVAATERCQS